MPAAGLPPHEGLRDTLELPEMTEGQIVRYFTRLNDMNWGVDSTFYPLGSCTMKYNPKLHEEAARLPGLAGLHPMQPEESVQGALKLMHRLQVYLGEVTGLPGVSLAPMAGAHGELAGMLITRAYLGTRNGEQGMGNEEDPPVPNSSFLVPSRTEVLIPDSAHGTNPASAAMAGFQVITVPSDRQGNMSLEALKKALSSRTASIMLTLPNTLGLFDPHIEDVCRLVHEAGGLVYGDGANMNALLGQVKLGELGFDIVHLNLHKTFSTPHGGGGPGAGPVCVTRELAPFLPAPVVSEEGKGKKRHYVLATPEKSIGSLGAFHGNFGVLVRAYAYVRSLGSEGLRQVSEDAVLNANYLLHYLKEDYLLPYDRPCMHEVVISAKRQKAHGVKALDIAKRLIDYGIHPPTMYFPLIVDEALMIEPTETESKETLDEFIAAMKAIAREAESQPELLREAPHSTPVSRLDEARAARQPDLRWKPGT